MNKKQQELKDLEDSINDAFEDMKKLCNIRGNLDTLTKFKQSFEDSLKDDYYNYPRYSKETILNWFLNQCFGAFSVNRVKQKVIDNLDGILYDLIIIKKLQKDLRYPTCCGWVRESEVWTPERLAEYMNLPVEYVKSTVIYFDNKDDLQELLKDRINDSKNRLTELTEKYDIPTIED